MEVGDVPGVDRLNQENQPKTEILIIRRSSGDDGGGHHGGAWKIAYADFVTAMMAFFLVMWLINSANQATKARVASYFNPIKMTDATPAERALKDINNPKKSEKKTEKSPDKTEDSTVSEASAKQGQNNARETNTADDPLRDPYKTIEAIASEGQTYAVSRSLAIASEKMGDPFDPKAWEALREGKASAEAVAADSAVAPISQSDANLDGQKKVATNGEITPSEVKPPPQTSGPDKELVNFAKRTARQIQQAIVEAGVESELGVTVKVTTEGLLIILSDQTMKSMFARGSAKPTPALIEVIARVGRILVGQEGLVVVRGHTDAHQFKNQNFDNWQLSTQRAHMASYILMHEGLDERRILKIEGYGASEPLVVADPFADENRRVEFLLRK